MACPVFLPLPSGERAGVRGGGARKTSRTLTPALSRKRERE